MIILVRRKELKNQKGLLQKEDTSRKRIIMMRRKKSRKKGPLHLRRKKNGQERQTGEKKIQGESLAGQWACWPEPREGWEGKGRETGQVEGPVAGERMGKDRVSLKPGKNGPTVTA